MIAHELREQKRIEKIKNPQVTKQGNILRAIIKRHTNSDIMAFDRMRENVDARKMFCRLMREQGFQLIDIGRYLGKHHSTIIHQIRTCEELLETSKLFRKTYEKVRLDYVGEDKLIDHISDYHARMVIANLEKSIEALSLRINGLEETISKLTTEPVEPSSN